MPFTQLCKKYLKQTPIANFLAVITWHLTSVITIFFLGTILVQEPIWILLIEQPLIYGVLLFGYIVSVVYIYSRGPQLSFSGLFEVALVLIFTFGCGWILVLYVKEIDDSTIYSVSAIGLSVIIFIYFFSRYFRLLVFLGMAAFSSYVGLLHAADIFDFREFEPAQKNLISRYSVTTNLYDLRVDVFSEWVSPPLSNGGGLAALNDSSYLLAVGDGTIYHFNFENDENLNLHKLNIRAPINWNSFASGPGSSEARWFRVMDILAVEDAPIVKLFVAHHYWNDVDQCFTMRVSKLTLKSTDMKKGRANSNWTTLFDAKPCYYLAPRGHRVGNENGGRLALLDKDNLLLTVGDHERDGVTVPTMASQDLSSSYGKTIKIDINSGHNEIFTLGNRNPQGVFVDKEGVAWSTEHGPQGGDEFNRLEPGSNYGWPYVSYGVAYGSREWPLNQRQGRHEGFRLPIFVWTPSIGISNLIKLENKHFSHWEGDFLISSLRAETIFRLRYNHGRVIFAEPIELGFRVRDLVEGNDGRIVVWSDSRYREIVSLRNGHDDFSGESLFQRRCGACHNIDNSGKHSIGPNLYKVIGKKAGNAKGYQYSAAMSSSSEIWSEQKVSAFLMDSENYLEGTSMNVRIENDAERTAIIDYLMEF